MPKRKGEERKKKKKKEKIKNKRRRDKRKKLDATIGNLTFLNINQKYHLPNSGLEKSGKRGSPEGWLRQREENLKTITLSHEFVSPDSH